jgi:simple sugar transport system permease protein
MSTRTTLKPSASEQTDSRRAFRPDAKTLTSHTAGLGALAVLILLVFSVLAPTTYPSALNLQSIGYAVPEIALLALAVTVTMSTGGIDLSVVATANLSALTTATLSMTLAAGGASGGTAVVLGALAGIGVGVFCGLINGALVTWARIAPILATLATMTLFAGVALVITRGKPLYGLPNELLDLGKATVAIVPISFWLLLLAAFGIWYTMKRTRFGLRLTLIGSSAEAADYTGLRRTNALLGTYALSGGIAALAGVLMTARTASASADYGSSYLLLAITIAVLGGTHATGGNSPIAGVTIAAVVLQMIASGLNLLNINPYIYQIVQGLILVGVLILELRRGRLDELVHGLLHRHASRAAG